MKNNTSGEIALGGVFAALAVVIMCLGGLIPGVTFITPVVCCLILQLVHLRCRARIAWAWYGAVSFLCLLLAPDKESAVLFLMLGYYPIVKPRLDRRPLSWLWKGLLFNASLLVTYGILIGLLGMAELAEEFAQMGIVLLILMLVTGNAVFFLLDRLLGRRIRRR